MTPDPPSSSEGSSLPPRHRPNLGSLAKDTTEVDLWAFDEIQPLEDEEPAKPPKAPAVPPARPGRKPPEKTKGGKPAMDASGPGENAAAKAASESVKVNVSGKNRPLTPSAPPAGQSRPGSDFDDLDHWEDVIEDYPVEPAPALAAMPVGAPELSPVAAVPAPDLEPATPEVPTDDEFQAPVRENAVPVSLRPHLSLSPVEKIGIAVLVALLLIGGIVLYYKGIHGLKGTTTRVVRTDFPLKGAHLAVASADTYWREPVAGSDTVRRGTVLIPELVMKPESGSATIRVFFRNSDGEIVGDAVTRSVNTGAEIRVAATTGFEEAGMHAAYRTGQSKPWTVEVHEAPYDNSKEFQKLFVMDISADRH